MDSTSTKPEQSKPVTKRVSFQEEVTSTPRRIPLHPQIPSSLEKQQNDHSNSSSKPTSLSSFKGNTDKTLPPSGSSMLGKLINDSLVSTKGENQNTRGPVPKSNQNENSTLTNIRTDYKYYF